MLTVKQIATRAAALARRQGAVNEEIHTLLCHSAVHAWLHGDVTSFDRIFDAVKGADRRAIARWVADFGFTRLGETGFRLNKAAREDYTGDAEGLLHTLLNGVKWWEYAPDKRQVARSLDLEARVASLLAQVENPPEGVEIKNVELARYLRDALTRYHLMMEAGN